MGLTCGGHGAEQSPRTRGFSGWGGIELGRFLPTPVSGDSDNWTDNTNWLSAAPLEDWHGVEVTDGRVTRLRLGGWDQSVGKIVGNGLTGSLPPELGTLSGLRWLEAAGNSGLTGPIPPELGNLANLETLSLQENWLTGSIPAALGRLANLERVWFHSNALTGSIPTELGTLIDLRSLTLGQNTLSGQVPPELGNLTSLEDLYLGNTMLGGALPASMSGLSALESLSLDGSGLCVPDTPTMQAWVATIADFTGVVCEGSVSFSRMVTQVDLDPVDSLFAVVDLNGDGRADVLGGEYLEYNVAAPERLTKRPLRVFVGEGNGGFRHAPELVAGTIDVRTPIVVADDFNGDGRADLAVFDAGVYVFAQRVGVGNPPQLLLSSPDGRLRPSEALADAVRREHEQRPQGPPKGISGPADLHLKSATSGDIDGDGDIDLWVDSRGGRNRVVCGRGRNPTLSVSRCPWGRCEKIREVVCRFRALVPIHEVWLVRRANAAVRTRRGRSGILATRASMNLSGRTGRLKHEDDR